jgi:hypothetical protein
MTPFIHRPAVHHALTLSAETRRLLREVLAKDPEDTTPGAPLILCQQMTKVGPNYRLLRGINLLVAGVDGDRMPPIGRAGLGDAAGQLALAFDAERNLAKNLAEVATAERLGYDNFMMEEVLIDILHFPGALAIGWDMTDKRLKKLLKNQPQDQPPALRSNNPPAALGTIVLEEAASNHARLNAAAELADARARLARWMRLRSGDLPLTIGEPETVLEE